MYSRCNLLPVWCTKVWTEICFMDYRSYQGKVRLNSDRSIVIFRSTWQLVTWTRGKFLDCTPRRGFLSWKKSMLNDTKSMTPVAKTSLRMLRKHSEWRKLEIRAWFISAITYWFGEDQSFSSSTTSNQLSSSIFLHCKSKWLWTFYLDIYPIWDLRCMWNIFQYF